MCRSGETELSWVFLAILRDVWYNNLHFTQLYERGRVFPCFARHERLSSQVGSEISAERMAVFCLI